ncbi:MAG TPA: HNH endonuclease [Myxococcales bacterium]|nr:HNH endonuclease [Myxococcales bacterium]
MDALRSGAVHLAGLRLLTPKLTADNHREVLADATGKSKREIEEIVARLAPRPDAPTIIRRIPDRLAQPVNGAATADDAAAPNGAAKANGRERHCQKIAPLNTEMFRIHFTASRQLRDKLREAQDLLDRTAKGDVATIFELALDALIERTRKKRFGIGAKPRKTPAEKERPAAKKDASRAIPRPMRRSVVNRDESRCAFVDQRGKRCPERRVEFDHIDGFAITGKHDFDRIRLLCRAHNQQAADALYGRSFMNAVRSAKRKKSGAKKGRSPPPASE